MYNETIRVVDGYFKKEFIDNYKIAPEVVEEVKEAYLLFNLPMLMRRAAKARSRKELKERVESYLYRDFAYHLMNCLSRPKAAAKI